MDDRIILSRANGVQQKNTDQNVYYQRGSRIFPFSLRLEISKFPCVICGVQELIEADHTFLSVALLAKRLAVFTRNRLTNDELRAWFSLRRVEHFKYHAYLLAIRYINPFDRPSFKGSRYA